MPRWIRTQKHIQKCTLCWNLILIWMSQLSKLMKRFKQRKIEYLKNGTWVFFDMKKFWNFVLKPTFLEVMIFSRGNLKACVRYFLSNFYFFTKWQPFKNYEVFFISSKKLFSFLRYLNVCNFFPSFPHFRDTKGQMGVE